MIWGFHLPRHRPQDRASQSVIPASQTVVNLYQWDDISEAEYLTESRDIKQQLESIVRPEEDEAVLDRLRTFLTDVGLAPRNSGTG